MKYGKYKNIPVYIMQRVPVGKNKLAIQSLVTGQTKVVTKTQVKNITPSFKKVMRVR